MEQNEDRSTNNPLRVVNDSPATWRDVHTIRETITASVNNPTIRTFWADLYDSPDGRSLPHPGCLNDPDAMNVYVEEHTLDLIYESSHTIPQPDCLADLGLGLSGIAVFEHPISSVSAITWHTPGRPEEGCRVFPWVRLEHLDDVLPLPERHVGAFVPLPGSVIHDRATEYDIFDGPAGAETWTDSDPFQKLLCALGAWMQHTVRPEAKHAPRSERRRHQRQGTTPPPPTRVIKLRRLETTHAPGEQQGGGSNFTSQWVVRGHWRNQACGPNRSRRRPIYIHPHIKGPDNAPINNPPKVFKVDR